MRVAVREPGPMGGVTVAEVNLRFAGDVIAPIHVGDTGMAYVTDSRGHLIAHRDLGLVLKGTDLSSLPHVRSAIAPLHSDPGGQGTAVVGYDRLGREVLASYRILRPTGWIVLVEQPTEEAFAPIHESIWRTGAMVALGLLLSIFASLILTRRMV